MKFALDITTQSLVTFVVGIVSGAGGFAGIKSYFLRPKLKHRARDYNLVRASTLERQERIEKILREQSLPTSFTEIKWKNFGRRPARHVEIEVLVPRGYIGHHVSPSDPETITGPYTVSEAPVKEGHRVQLRQEFLVPKKLYTLTIEYDSPEVEPEVRFLEDHREVPDSDEERENSATDTLILLAMIVTVLLALVGLNSLLFSSNAQGNAPPAGQHPSQSK